MDDKIDDLTTRELRERLAEHAKNWERMKACKVHNFRRLDVGSSIPRRKCENCGGVIPNYLWEWYERGLQDAFFVACDSVKGGG